MKVLAHLLAFIALPAWAQVEIERPWTRATPPGAKVAAGYMVIRNKASAPDRLVSAASPVAARVETHITVQEGNVSRMREVKGYAIPAGGSFELKPGGAHLMLVDIKHPIKQGEKVPATLHFERAGDVNVELEAEAMGAAAHGHGGMDMKMH